MASLDLFVINVALHDLSVEFGASSLSDVSWVINAYSIFFGALLVPAGRLSDHFGGKRAFVVGLVIFTLSSLACALSPNLWALIAFRCLQAAGAAALVPASLSLVLTTLPADHVQRGVRAWAVTGSLAGATGPVVGGLLTELGWRWVFLINLPIGLLALVSAVFFVSAPPRNHQSVLPNPVEVASIVIALGALALGIVKGPDWGFTSLRLYVVWMVAAAGAVLFVLGNRRARQPVIALSLFRSRFFSAANAGMALYSLSMVMTILGVTLYLQTNWHWSAIATGAAIAPGPASLFVTAQVLNRVSRRPSMAAMVTAGLVIVAVGQLGLILSLTYLPSSYGYAVVILPGWILTGVGSGLSLPALTGSATIGLPATASAVGSAVVQVSRQLGTVVGSAVLVAVLGAATTTGATGRYLAAWWIAIAVCLAGGVVSALGLRRRLDGVGTAPAVVPTYDGG
jgi:EmrB/QacA subfamily drug resistance transporter